MRKYRLKPDIESFEVDAVQWMKHGDHPAVTPIYGVGDKIDELCGCPGPAHGFLKTPEGIVGVCPGDWVVRRSNGQHWRFRKNEFALYYEPSGRS